MLLNKQSDLQSIPGDGTKDMRGKVSAGFLGNSLFSEENGVYFLDSNVWVLNEADSLQPGTRDTATFMVDAVRNSVWLWRDEWHVWDPCWLPHCSGQSTAECSDPTENGTAILYAAQSWRTLVVFSLPCRFYKAGFKNCLFCVTRFQAARHSGHCYSSWAGLDRVPGHYPRWLLIAQECTVC